MSYWERSYFGAASPAVPVCLADPAPSPDDRLTDGRVLGWIGATLEESGLFTWVGVGSKAGLQLAASSFPSAWVYPVSFAEDDNFDPDELVRKLRYAVAVSAVGPTYAAAQGRLDLLSAAVSDLLAGGPPGYLPALSRVEGGRYDGLIPTSDQVKAAVDPTSSAAGSTLTLTGTYAYLIEGRAGRSPD